MGVEEHAMLTNLSIRSLGPEDRDAALAVINAAARWYREFLPEAKIHDPEMTPDAWDAEARRMTWCGAFADGALVGVMGLEYVRDVALLRHAYVLPDQQRRGVGTRLREHLESQVHGVHRVLVGTYAANHKARQLLEKAGYRLVSDSAATLRQYYSIPEDRLRTSVVYEKRVESVEPRRPQSD
jgi:GNAT superfamily N-acetyltransferase